MTLEAVLFWTFALLTCGSAAAIILTQNIVRMALWLVVCLGSVAALFFLLHADFLGASQLLVYVGGTVVLLVFGVMLTASGPHLKLRTPPGEILLGAIAGAALLSVLIFAVTGTDWDTVVRRGPSDVALEVTSSFPREGATTRPLGWALIGLRPDSNLHLEHEGQAKAGYLLPFELISVHLLVVLIGAAYLGRAKRRLSVDAEEELTR